MGLRAAAGSGAQPEMKFRGRPEQRYAAVSAMRLRRQPGIRQMEGIRVIATFDIGTTAVKGVLVGEDGRALDSASVEIETFYEGEYKEQNPESWFDAFCRISGRFLEVYPKAQIDSIIMSGQMQDVILVDENFLAVRNAVLYSDARAQAEAEEIIERLGEEYLTEATGNHYDGSLPLPKLMWIRRYEPQVWEKTSKILISSKDYVIGRLTGIAAGDVTACSTAGCMRIADKIWDQKILDAAGVDAGKMPRLYFAHQAVGAVTEEAAAQCGYLPGTKVYAGAGDAGATTLASGITNPGEYNINLGTSGWVAAVSDRAVQTEGGVFNLAAMPDQCYINVVPFLNAGNVHRWISRILTPGERREIDYALMEQLLENSEPGSRQVMFLPYLAGERFPVMDAAVRGTYVGITPETNRGDMIRSCLEGVAFSIRQGIESLGTGSENVPDASAGKISIIGGGARSASWCRIFADVLQQPVYVYRSAEVLPALAIAAAVLLEQGKLKSYAEFTSRLQGKEYCIAYQPDRTLAKLYDAQYRKYCTLYPAVKAFYAGV